MIALFNFELDLKYIIIIIVILSILPLFEINIQCIITGLGITAAIIGLAFQYIAGDTIEIGDFKEKVTRMGLKTTRIKDKRAKTKIIANHNITEVINYNLEDSEVTSKITTPVNSMEQYITERIIHKKIKDTLDKEGIKMPYPQIEVHHEK